MGPAWRILAGVLAVLGRAAFPLELRFRRLQVLIPRQVRYNEGLNLHDVGERRMTGLGLKDLVGRVMIDPEFLQSLVRDPDTVLADYQLSEEERQLVLQAIAKLARTPAGQRAQVFQTTLVRRWAT